jgi:hypothetical protein
MSIHSGIERGEEIEPVRIATADQIGLPRPLPSRERLFAHDSVFDPLMPFDIKKQCQSSLFSEIRTRPGAVLDHTCRNV